MRDAIGGLFQGAGDFEAEHERASVGAACGRRALHDGGDRGSLGGVGGALGAERRVEALKGESDVDAFASRNQDRRLDGADEMADAIGGDRRKLGERASSALGARVLRDQADEEGGLVEAIERILDLIDHRQQLARVAYAAR